MLSENRAAARVGRGSVSCEGLLIDLFHHQISDI